MIKTGASSPSARRSTSAAPRAKGRRADPASLSSTAPDSTTPRPHPALPSSTSLAGAFDHYDNDQRRPKSGKGIDFNPPVGPTPSPRPERDDVVALARWLCLAPPRTRPHKRSAAVLEHGEDEVEEDEEGEGDEEVGNESTRRRTRSMAGAATGASGAKTASRKKERL